MLKIGLTGSIATGKSTALAAFAEAGVPVFSADDAVHALYAGPAAAAVEQLFPGTSAKGVVDRQALSRALLSHPERLGALEALIHPMVRAAIAAFLAKAEATGAALAVVDIPLLFETGHNSGHDYGLDRVIVVSADLDIQRRRALARPGMSVEKLDAILARQLPQAEKRARADYCLDGSGSRAALQAEVRALIQTMSAKPTSSGAPQ